jgi:hypothetical protein
VAPRAARSCRWCGGRVGEGERGGPDLIILRGFIPPFKSGAADRQSATPWLSLVSPRLHAPLIRTAPTHILFASPPTLSLSLSLSPHASAWASARAVVHLAQAQAAGRDMTAADGEACAVVATAADIICSLRGADLAGWTPPWSQRQHEPDPARDGVQAEGGDDARDLAWPAVARGKRSRSRRDSPSASGSAASAGAATTTTTKKKKKTARRGARGSPASPLDYSGASGSGASTSGGEDGAFCSRPDPALPPAAACQQLAAPPPPSKVLSVRARARAYLTSDIPRLRLPLVWFGRLVARLCCCGCGRRRLVGCVPIRVRAWLGRRTGQTDPPCQQHEDDDFPMTHRFSRPQAPA